MKFYKMILISLILVILSMSCVNANDLTNDAIQSDLSDIDNQFALSNDLNEDIQDFSDYDSDLIEDISYFSNHDSELKEDININNDSFDFNKESNQNTKVLNSNQLDSNQLDSNQLYYTPLNSDQENVYIVSSNNYSKYFDKNGILKGTIVPEYATLDLSGNFFNKNFIFTAPCHITSSYGAKLTNCMIKFENMTASGRSSVSSLHIRNSEEWVAGVYLLNSRNVDVYGNDIFCTGANGNPVRVIYSNYSSIFNNKLETNFTGYMNLSWKRAGILLGDSHYNNIYSNDVTIKDSNPIYLTTYGFEKSNYNVIFNNTVRSSAISEDSGLSNPSAWAYGIHLMGDFNQALNNTIHNVYRGIDSEGSFNILSGNIIFNLTGGYFEGNDGTEGGDYGIHASYDNIVANNTIFNSKLTGSAIYLMPNNTAYGNIIYNIGGHSGLELNNYADNCHVYDNIFDVPLSNPIYLFGRMNNVTIENNILSSVNASSILIKKQSSSKYPTNITITNNLIMGYLKTFNQSPIDYSQVPNVANIKSYNNSITVYNETFLNYFDGAGQILDCSKWNALLNLKTYQDCYNYNSLVFAGNFSNLIDEILLSKSMISLKSFADSRISNSLRQSNFEEYDLLIETLNGIYMDYTVFNNICFVLNSSNLKIDSFTFNFTEVSKNGFVIEGKENISFSNNRLYFKSNSSENNLIFIDHVSGYEFLNNLVLVDSKNYALAVNNSNASLKYNNIKINDYHSAILDANQSLIVLDENIIESLLGITVDCINSTYPKFSIYTIDDNNYHLFFNDDGSFRNDFDIEFGNTLKLANLTNKKFLIDIPLKITSLSDESKLINSFISFEGEGSNSILSNLNFEINDDLEENNGFLPIVSIKDGVSDLSIFNNRFCIDLNKQYNGSFASIRLFGSDYISKSIQIENNSFILKSNSDELYGIYVSNKKDLYNYKVYPKDLKVINNEFLIESNNLAKAIYLDSVEYIWIENNFIDIKSVSPSNLNLGVADSAYGIDLNHANGLNLNGNTVHTNSASSIGFGLRNSSDFVISNNFLNVSGGFLEELNNYDLSDFSLSAILVRSNIGNNLIKDSYLFLDELNGTLIDNKLYENDLFVLNIHSSNSTRDLQNLIDDADSGDIIKLGKTVYSNLDTLFIKKNLTISGGVFLSNNNWKPLFEIIGNSSVSSDEFNPSNPYERDDGSKYSKDYNSFNNFNINDGTYLLNNADILVSVNAYNGTDRLSIEVPQINIFNNSFLALNDSIVAESINILKLMSDRNALAPTNSIFIGNNTLTSGINPFRFEISSIMKDSDIDINSESLVQKKDSKIIFEDMVTTAFQSAIDGRVGKYFVIVLKDENSKVLPNKFIQIGFNGRIYNRTTNENGSARLQINLAYSGIYTFAISFLGDLDYNGSFAVAKITVKKQSPILSVSDKIYKVSAKSKTLQACLKSINGSPIKFKKISFLINGKTYTASTDSKGIATVKVSLSTKKTYKFTVKSASDGTYSAVSKSGKLTIK